MKRDQRVVRASYRDPLRTWQLALGGMMLEVIREPILKDRLLTGRIEAHCRRRTWSFCTAESGVAIVEAIVREGIWSWDETRPICREIEANYHPNMARLAAWLNLFEATSCDVVVQPVQLSDQVGVSLSIYGSSLHDGVLATFGTAACLLDGYRQKGTLRAGDCINAMQQMIRVGMADTISANAFRTLTGGIPLTGLNEYRYRRAVGQL